MKYEKDEWTIFRCMLKNLLIVSVLISMIFLSIGCIDDNDSIGEINNNPDQFTGTVRIKGEVIEKYSVSLINMGGYKINDGTGSIWIVTTSGVPEVGDKIKVNGYIATSFKLGTLNLGTVIKENSRSKLNFIEGLF